jgi:nucleotide-binding universal stress UspA family protein
VGRYRKILVAFDGSAAARAALAYALELARAERSWVKILAVVPRYEGQVELVGVHDIGELTRGPVERHVREALDLARPTDVPVLYDIEQGEPFEKIIDVCEEEGCDLIVMGRKGHRRLEKMLMGSVTARVVETCARNVLVVPPDVHLDWGRVLFFLDSGVPDGAVREVLRFSLSHGSTIEGVAVVDMYPEFYAEAPEIVERMERLALEALGDFERRAGAEGVAVRTHLMRGEPHAEIAALAGELGTGLIVIDRTRNSAMRGGIAGGLIGRVIGYADCPVLVL